VVVNHDPQSSTLCAFCQQPFDVSRPGRGGKAQRFCSPEHQQAAHGSGARRRRHYGTDRGNLGIDGEAIENRYFLLGASNGDYIESDTRLTTDQCLKFLISLPKSPRKWGFAFGYDVNHILRDMPKDRLERLVDTGETTWGVWWIRYLPRKLFLVYHRPSKRSVAIWDAWPFVQSSFVNWLRDWKLTDDDTLATIDGMKLRRATFSEPDREAIRHYCLAECRYLATGAGRIVNLHREAGVPLRSYYGPGSTAAALMERHKVRRHYVQAPDAEAVQSAYFGGRIESAIVGRIPGGFMLDIRSAYPAWIARLPCLSCGWWQYGVEPSTKWALVRARWAIEERVIWGPLPVRPPSGTIRYPRNGEGWYWWHEIQAARALAPIEILESWSYVIECDHQPFDWVHDLYRQRQEWRAAGDARNIPLKLGLNSIYGKLAQRLGKAPFRAMEWAGMITAGTRSDLMGIIAADPSNVLMTATDGLLVEYLPELDFGEGLGQWEARPVGETLIAQPGVYWSDKVRSRGFAPHDLKADDVWEALSRRTIFSWVDVPVTRFIGMADARHRNAWDQWATWRTQIRHLYLNPWPRRYPLRFNLNGEDFIRTMAPPDILRGKHPSDGEAWEFVLAMRAAMDQPE
jgi:hypothetical protein